MEITFDIIVTVLGIIALFALAIRATRNLRQMLKNEKNIYLKHGNKTHTANRRRNDHRGQ